MTARCSGSGSGVRASVQGRADGPSFVLEVGMADSTPSFVVHIDEVDEVEGAYPAPFDGEKLTIYRDLGRAAGSRNLGLGYDRLPPGRRSSFTHAHSDEEEMVYVLAGTCHVRLLEPGAEPREIPLRAGHLVSFPAGTGIAHTFVNRGMDECTLIVIGERKPEVDRWVYPEDTEYNEHFARTHPERYWGGTDQPVSRGRDGG